jgi:hypothetical protein
MRIISTSCKGKFKFFKNKNKKYCQKHLSKNTFFVKGNEESIFIYNILSMSGGGDPFHPSVPSSVLSSIHPSSSSRRKKMMEEEEEEDEWR